MLSVSVVLLCSLFPFLYNVLVFYWIELFIRFFIVLFHSIMLERQNHHIFALCNIYWDHVPSNAMCATETHTAHTHNPVRYFKMNFGCILAFKVSCRLFLTLFNIRSTSTKSSHRHVKDVKHYIMKMVRRKQRVFYIPRQENNIHKYLYCTNWTNKKKPNFVEKLSKENENFKHEIKRKRMATTRTTSLISTLGK